MKTAKIEEYIKSKDEISVAEIQFVFNLKYSEACRVVNDLVERNILFFKGGITYENIRKEPDIWGVRDDKKADWEYRDISNDIDPTDKICNKTFIEDVLSGLYNDTHDNTKDIINAQKDPSASTASERDRHGKGLRNSSSHEKTFGYRLINGKLLVDTDKRYPDGDGFLIEKTERNGVPYFSDCGRTVLYLCTSRKISLAEAVIEIKNTIGYGDAETSVFSAEVVGETIWYRVDERYGAYPCYMQFCNLIDLIVRT